MFNIKDRGVTSNFSLAGSGQAFKISRTAAELKLRLHIYTIEKDSPHKVKWANYLTAKEYLNLQMETRISTLSAARISLK
ncbi:MAG: hypothetical protein ACM3RX_10175 [Methanococcaceae archaeon]